MKKNKFRTNNNIVFNCRYHVVFCPKRRKKVLVGKIPGRLENIFIQVCDEFNIDLLALEIMPDHVHIALGVDPQFGIANAVKKLKGRSSNIMRKEFPELLRIPSLWTKSYFVSTFGDVSQSKILEYIKEQWQK